MNVVRRRILHLVGSPTSEFYFDLSLVYARGCIAALHDPERYEFVIALVQPDGMWRFPASLDPLAVKPTKPFALADALVILAGAGIDVAVPQMFCHAGMTNYRALLEALGIRYIGNRPLQMAATADKAMARAVVAAAGVDVPLAELLRRGERPTLALPVVVKPNAADNSDGIALVTQASDLEGAIAGAFKHSDAVLVETFVPLGREVRCGIVERDGAPTGRTRSGRRRWSHRARGSEGSTRSEPPSPAPFRPLRCRPIDPTAPLAHCSLLKRAQSRRERDRATTIETLHVPFANLQSPRPKGGGTLCCNCQSATALDQVLHLRRMSGKRRHCGKMTLNARMDCH